LKDLVSNKKALHDYEIIETYEAGIVLLGSEIKSLREHSASLQDSFIDIKDNELWLMNSSISPYKFSTSFTHQDKRKRKLLMNKSEILKISKQVKEKGMTLIPLSIYLKDSRAKVKVALAKGRKSYDKREVLKEKSQKRDIQKALKQQ
jgi:SsrA-binding protein